MMLFDNEVLFPEHPAAEIERKANQRQHDDFLQVFRMLRAEAVVMHIYFQEVKI